MDAGSEKMMNADFHNHIYIYTTNLGVREPEPSLNVTDVILNGKWKKERKRKNSLAPHISKSLQNNAVSPHPSQEAKNTMPDSCFLVFCPLKCLKQHLFFTQGHGRLCHPENIFRPTTIQINFDDVLPNST